MTSQQQCGFPGGSVDKDGRVTRVQSRVAGFQGRCTRDAGHDGDHDHPVTWRGAQANVPSRTRDWNRANDGADW